MKIKTKIKAFISIEIILLFFTTACFLKIYKNYLENKQISEKFHINKKKLMVLKKYLCSFIKNNKCLPPINKFNEIDFQSNKFLEEIPNFYKNDSYEKPFKAYLGSMENNEIIYLKIHNTNYKIIIYGHDINIYSIKELKEFFNQNKKVIILINNEKK